MRLIASTLLVSLLLNMGNGSYGADSSNSAKQQSPFALSVEKAKMDETKIKPFTLNAAKNISGDEDDALTMERNAKLDADMKTAKANADRFALDASKNYKLLANYKLEILVDRSLSMRKPDCPGGLSRWEWCGSQAADLAKALSTFVPCGFTIVPFAGEYDVFEHASATNIEYLFNNIGLQRGTRLYEPLAERLDTFFTHYKPGAKPLLLVVITDGIPQPKWEPQLVKDELIQASKKMTSPGEVTIVFCQIGCRDQKGQDYLFDLDENLTANGAKYHYIHTVGFDALQERGLGSTLITCLQQYGQTRTLSARR
jgi:hypothetical protein